LIVPSVGQRILSKDTKICRAVQGFVESERRQRGIAVDPEPKSRDWQDEHGKSGTNVLVARIQTVCRRLEISLKIWNKEMVLKRSESEFKIKTAVGVGRFLIEKILGPDKFNRRRQFCDTGN
jgi:hypothetical protein